MHIIISLRKWEIPPRASAPWAAPLQGSSTLPTSGVVDRNTGGATVVVVVVWVFSEIFTERESETVKARGKERKRDRENKRENEKCHFRSKTWTHEGLQGDRMVSTFFSSKLNSTLTKQAETKFKQFLLYISSSLLSHCKPYDKCRSKKPDIPDIRNV